MINFIIEVYYLFFMFQCLPNISIYQFMWKLMLSNFLSINERSSMIPGGPKGPMSTNQQQLQQQQQQQQPTIGYQDPQQQQHQQQQQQRSTLLMNKVKCYQCNREMDQLMAMKCSDCPRVFCAQCGNSQVAPDGMVCLNCMHLKSYW